MDSCPTDDRIARLVNAIRTANVRDSDYKVAERQLIELGDSARPVLAELICDQDIVVRERANELLKKLGSPSSQ